MNLILLRDEDLRPDGTARLSGRRARHVAEVHRAAPGDTLVVGLLGGPIGEGRVLSSSPEALELELRFTAAPPPGPGIELLWAMPRPKILRKALQMVAQVGVKRLVLVNSSRVEKSYFDSPLLAPAALEEELALGLEQARDTILPEVLIRRRFRPFVEDELDALWPSPTQRLLAHPVAPGPLEALAPEGERAVLAVGPEGGWIPFELELLEAHGFRRFSLGPRILRVDTALPFLLGQLELWRRLARGGPARARGIARG